MDGLEKSNQIAETGKRTLYAVFAAGSPQFTGEIDRSDELLRVNPTGFLLPLLNEKGKP